VDLQRVDDQAQLLHLRAAGGPGLPGELLPVADHVLDRQPAHDRTEMTREHVVHPLRHQLLLVQEAAGRVGDRHEVVAHLEDDHAPHLQRNALVGHAVDVQFGLVEVEGESAYRLHARQHERAAPGDDAEPQALFQPFGPMLRTGNDQRFIGLRDTPHELEEHDNEDQCEDDGPRDDADDHRHAPPLPGAWSAPNEGECARARPRGEDIDGSLSQS
jgi:hypothetical protein